MATKTVSLAEAKRILKRDRIFDNGDGTFNYIDEGKYNSKMVFVIPKKWPLDQDGNPLSPIEWTKNRELTDNMNLDFGGDASVIFGEYEKTRHGPDKFRLTEPTKAKNMLVCVNWGGAFNHVYGKRSDYAREAGAEFFLKASSNGGREGRDYWVLPTSYVKGKKTPRDVTGLLSKIEQEREDKISGMEKEFLEKEKIRLDKSTKTRYADKLVTQMESYLERKEHEKTAREEFVPMFRQMEGAVRSIGNRMEYKEKEAHMVLESAPRDSWGHAQTEWYDYSPEGYEKFADDIEKCQADMEKREQELLGKIAGIKEKSRVLALKEAAKMRGYPEIFEFRSKTEGRAGLSHAFVIRQDGSVREPDYGAAGIQGYDQVLPGEAVISYKKMRGADPFVFNVEWADGSLSMEQAETARDLLWDMAEYAVDREGNIIIDPGKWVMKTAVEKAAGITEPARSQEGPEVEIYGTDNGPDYEEDPER